MPFVSLPVICLFTSDSLAVNMPAPGFFRNELSGMTIISHTAILRTKIQNKESFLSHEYFLDKNYLMLLDQWQQVTKNSLFLTIFALSFLSKSP